MMTVNVIVSEDLMSGVIILPHFEHWEIKFTHAFIWSQPEEDDYTDICVIKLFLYDSFLIGCELKK